MKNSQDEQFLRQTLNLAKKGISWTNPNPMVGAVIVKDGRIIGKGYHKAIGLPHAEIEALKTCIQSPKGATLYVNLEPCTHSGRTPPCVDTIITSQVKRVVCCTLDPNPKTTGLGAARLQKAGILFDVGLLEDEARVLNEAFFTFHERKRPFIAIKFAASLDGKIATKKGYSKWITNEKARQFARGLRSQYQAVLVGINTILKDDPHLGVRIKGKKDPLRIILGYKKQIPKNFQVLRDQNVLIINPKNIHDLLAILKEKEILSILVEGGSKTLGFFVDEKLFDKVYAFYAPIIIGGGKAKTIVQGEGVSRVKDATKLKQVSFKKFDDNFLMIGYK